MRNNKGITLVALVITIIVMLILVAVSVSVALNGGLFDKAREASWRTVLAQIQEDVNLKIALYEGEVASGKLNEDVAELMGITEISSDLEKENYIRTAYFYEYMTQDELIDYIGGDNFESSDGTNGRAKLYYDILSKMGIKTNYGKGTENDLYLLDLDNFTVIYRDAAGTPHTVND